MGDVIQSAWWIIYYIETDWEPRYLLIKRHALSGKIEWVSPKWKLQWSESADKAAMREVAEETGIPVNQLRLKQILWVTKIRNTENKWPIDKDVTYFLMQFLGNPDVVNIQQAEWYLGIHKWATMEDVLWLIYYNDIRELIRQSYLIIKQSQKNTDVKKDFMDKLF